MGKKLLMTIPAVALGMASIASTGAHAVETTYIDVTQEGATTLESCLSSVQENEACRLTQDLTISGLTINRDAIMNVDLNNHTINTGSIQLQQGDLNFVGNGGIINTSDSLPLFILTGADSYGAENYSVLGIGGGANLTSGSQSAIVIEGKDVHGNYRAYGTVVNLTGNINARNGIEIFNVGRSTHGGTVPEVNIYDGASITATENAILASSIGSWEVGNADLKTTGENQSAVKLSDGNFSFTNTSISATEKGGSVFEIVEGSDTSNASISIDGGEYLGTVNFLLEENVDSQTGLGGLSIKDGIFVAETLFNTEGSHFNQTGFIESGIFQDWNPNYEQEGSSFIESGNKFKDYVYTSDGQIALAISKISSETITNLPEGYTSTTTHKYLTDRDSLTSLNLLREKTRFEGTILSQRLDIEIFNAAGEPTTTLDGEGASLNFFVTGLPELAEGYTRSYYMISCHDSASGFCTEDRVNGTITEVQYKDGYIIAEGLKEFSSFYFGYVDTYNPVPSTPDTGANTAEQVSNVLPSSIILCVLAGITTSVLTGIKLFRKK